MANEDFVSWHDFICDITARFKDSKESRAVEEFNKLNQNGTLEEYIDECENLRYILLQNGFKLAYDYVELENFMGGLKDALKPFLRAFNLTKIAEAIKFARL